MNILLVDDEPDIRAFLRMMLGFRGERCSVVAEAGDGVEAIERVRDLRPDVVVMDYRMPKVNGVEATRVISAEFPHIRVLGYTSEPESVGEMLAAGAAAAFRKEDLDGLLNALECFDRSAEAP